MNMKKHGQGKPVTPADHLSGVKPGHNTNNTKAPMTKTIPTGKPHAKIVEANQHLKIGKYL